MSWAVDVAGTRLGRARGAAGALLLALLGAAACAHSNRAPSVAGAHPEPGPTEAVEPLPPAPAPAPASAAVLGRLAVLGASASNGVLLSGGLADALAAAIAAPHEPPLDATSVMFFLLGEQARANLVERALAHGPSAVIGLDFLFWYGYGAVPETERLALLERGLAQLARFTCPVVISEFPDMSPAVGLMLQAVQVPRPQSLTALNRRLREWADARPNVIVVPLPEVLSAMRAGGAVRVGEHAWPAGSEARFLQPDKLHPTVEGLVVMACLVEAGLRARIPGLRAEDFLSDPAAIAAAFRDATRGRAPRRPF